MITEGKNLLDAIYYPLKSYGKTTLQTYTDSFNAEIKLSQNTVVSLVECQKVIGVCCGMMIHDKYRSLNPVSLSRVSLIPDID